MPKKLFIKKIHNLFSQVEIHPWYQTLWTFPLFVRITIGLSFFFLLIYCSLFTTAWWGYFPHSWGISPFLKK